MMDLIERQAVINAIENTDAKMSMEEWNEITDAVMEVPLAHPEIIRCKDCKNSEHWYRDRRRCFLWSDNGVSVFDDGFCNYAERRTDESD